MREIVSHKVNYSPEQLAERWQCSANTIRNLVRSGELFSIRVGQKLIRIPLQAIEEFEQCQ